MTDDHGHDPWAVEASAFPADGSVAEQARFLLGYAILAPSTHNSQPWAFGVDDDTVHVFADESRAVEVADPDGRELYVSLGCAVENLVVAAERFGFEATVDLAPETDRGLAATVTLRETDAESGGSELFDAITERRTNHGAFEDRPLGATLRDRFREAVGDDAELHLVDGAAKTDVAALQASADERQFDDPAYRAELARYVGSGALGATWLAARVGGFAVRHLDLGEREGRKNSRLVESAAAVGVLATARDDRAARIEAGRAFERLHLHATTAGVAVHPMNQILQVPDLEADLIDRLDVGDRSLQLLFRLGYAPEEGATRPRRPLEAVLRA